MMMTHKIDNPDGQLSFLSVEHLVFLPNWDGGRDLDLVEYNFDGQLSFYSDGDGDGNLDLVVGNPDGQLNDCPSVLVPRVVLVYEGRFANLHGPSTNTGSSIVLVTRTRTSTSRCGWQPDSQSRRLARYCQPTGGAQRTHGSIP